MGREISERDYILLKQIARAYLAGKLTNKAPHLRRRSAGGGGGGGGTDIRKAFAKAAASSGTTLVCYLDVDDAESEEITVNFEIPGGSNLNASLPKIVNGTMIPVFQTADELWHAFFPMTQISTFLDLC